MGSRTIRNRKAYFWKDWDEEDLLNLPMKRLGLKIERSRVYPLIRRVLRELKEKDILFEPHFWFGEEFFSPNGVPGVAIPFYLGHPRLEKLEKKHMYEAEGSTDSWFLKILRHEVGHAVEHAYQLTRKKKRQKVFGKSTTRYPDSYSARPFSKSYVLNLENWYAQAHPDEDFAETFAVWLKPRSRWRQIYKGWPALKKLECVDELMQAIRGKRPPNHSRAKIDPLERLNKTLGEYYAEKKERYGLNTAAAFYDQDLLRLFSNKPEFKKNKLASRFLRGIRREVRAQVAKWTGHYQYNVDEVFKEMIDRCHDLKLRLTIDEEKTKAEFIVLLTVHFMNYFHRGGYRLDL